MSTIFRTLKFGLSSSWVAIGMAVLLTVPSAACAESPATPAPQKSTTASDGTYAVLPPVAKGQAVAILAGGCFWCMESDFESIEGVIAVVSGYIGGHVKRPTYRQVGSRTSGHTEAIWVLYDPKAITYKKLLDEFWLSIDPTTKDRQFCDVGDEYRPEIFYLNPEQKNAAEKSHAALVKSKPFAGAIVVDVTKAPTFWTAESNHQDFYRTNPGRYYSYRKGCGRDAHLKALWGDQLKKSIKVKKH